MGVRIAWISSNDVAVQNRLEAALEQLGCEVAAFSLDSLLRGDLPFGAPDWVFVDFRDSETWQHLPTIEKRLRRPHTAEAAQIAIIDQGYPLNYAAQADAQLSGSLYWRNELGDLQTLLDEASWRLQNKQAMQVCGHRELVVGGHKYVTHTPALFPLFEKIQRAAEHDFTVLLVGETGTGKTTFARIVHELSRRRPKRFLTVACGAMPSELMGSELFGHVRGAFTGADREKEGKFDVAHNGTLLLDEIDVLDLEQQANLLRVIETGEFEPVGSNDTRTVDVRVIVASNQCLESAIRQNSFRADLYFRLNEVKFEIPPLRQRRGDIVPLAIEMMVDCCREKGLSVQYIQPEYLDLLRFYSWPGNVRELRNEVRHSVLFCADGVVHTSLLSDRVRSDAHHQRIESQGQAMAFGLSGEVARTEQEAIEDMLRLHDFNRAATARALGISRVTLYNKIRKYRIKMDE